VSCPTTSPFPPQKKGTGSIHPKRSEKRTIVVRFSSRTGKKPLLVLLVGGLSRHRQFGPSDEKPLVPITFDLPRCLVVAAPLPRPARPNTPVGDGPAARLESFPGAPCSS